MPKPTSKKSFYLYGGSWCDVFDKLVGVLQPRNANQFTVWESKARATEHLLIAYDTTLPAEIQMRHDFREISERDFHLRFRKNVAGHVVHGYNEFATKNSSGSLFRF